MSALDKIKQGKRLTAAFLYELLYGVANGDLATENNNLPLWREKSLPDYVVNGCVITGDSYGSTLYASMSAGQVIINGALIDVDAVANRAFTASKDTYVDVDINGALTYTEVSNNAASPALTTSRVRLGVIVTGASSIASANSVNQGQPEKTVPTTCNLGKSGIDSLGNKICRRDPHAPLIFSVNTNLGGSGDVTSLTLPLLDDTRLYITGELSTECVNTPSCALYSRLYVDGSNVDEKRIDTDTVARVWTNFPHSYQCILGAGSKIVKINLSIGGGGYFQYTCTTLKIIAYPVRY